MSPNHDEHPLAKICGTSLETFPFGLDLVVYCMAVGQKVGTPVATNATIKAFYQYFYGYSYGVAH